MLTRHRPAVLGHQRARGKQERPHPFGRGLEREVDPGVHAAVAEVPVGQRVQAVLVEQGEELPQIGAQLRRWHGGVFPARPGRRPVR